MDQARTAWAEGMDLSEEEIEALTLIGEEAGRRGFTGLLPCGDVWSWASTFEAQGWDDLAARVREVESNHEAAFFAASA